MQDVQNIPNPDVNSTERENEFGSHTDIERENEIIRSTDTDSIPLPPTEPKPAPVEEPSDTQDESIDEPERAPREIV